MMRCKLYTTKLASMLSHRDLNSLPLYQKVLCQILVVCCAVKHALAN